MVLGVISLVGVNTDSGEGGGRGKGRKWSGKESCAGLSKCNWSRFAVLKFMLSAKCNGILSCTRSFRFPCTQATSQIPNETFLAFHS